MPTYNVEIGVTYHGNLSCGNVYTIIAFDKDIACWVVWVEKNEKPNMWTDSGLPIILLPGFLSFGHTAKECPNAS